MMKWGRKKQSLASPFHFSSYSSIFPLSWLSKTKRNTKNEPAKGERDATQASWKNGRFYSGGDDCDCRICFGEENYEVRKSRGVLKSVWYDSENENQEFGFPSCRSCRTDDVAEREESLKFNQMVSNIRKLRELPSCEGAKGGENGEFKGLRRKVEKEQKSKKRTDGDLGEKKVYLEKQADKAEEADLVLQEREIFELTPVKLNRATKWGNHHEGAFSRNCNLDYMLKALKLVDEERVNWEKSKEMKPKELMAKRENQRKSVYITTESQRKTTKNSSKIRAYSPRTAYKIECKIKTIENIKREKKKEKRMREKPAQMKTAFNSFAVVKNSLDPQNDFKNSMIEMITVKGIKKSEELEELLACYLTLNADIYHDTIIKVFRQVWFELIRDHLAPAIYN